MDPTKTIRNSLTGKHAAAIRDNRHDKANAPTQPIAPFQRMTIPDSEAGKAARARAALLDTAPDMLLTLKESHRVLSNMLRAAPHDLTLPVVIRWMGDVIAKATGAQS